MADALAVQQQHVASALWWRRRKLPRRTMTSAEQSRGLRDQGAELGFLVAYGNRPISAWSKVRCEAQ